jgi:hypothetical protein
MKLRSASEVELQDVQVVVEEQRKRVSKSQAEKDTSAWFVENLFPTRNTLLLFSRSFVNLKN